MTDVVQKSLERLDGGFNTYARDPLTCTTSIPIDKPLAALIRASEKTLVDDCPCEQCVALIALCKAINGEEDKP